MHAMWMRTLPEGFDWDFPDFEPVLHDADQLISICCMEHKRDGLLRERLDLSLFFNGGAGLRILDFAWAVPSSSWGASDLEGCGLGGTDSVGRS